MVSVNRCPPLVLVSRRFTLAPLSKMSVLLGNIMEGLAPR